MPDVACLGILVADLIGRPIDHLPERGRLALVEDMSLHIGGCASNTSIVLAKLGIETAVLGKVGSDGLGDFVTSELGRSSVHCQGLVHDPHHHTSASMVIVDHQGERSFLHYLGANAHYTAEDINWEIVKSTRILHIGGALVLPGIDGEPMAEMMTEARRQGLIVTLDTVWDDTGRWMKTLAPCLPHADLFCPSLSEAQKLAGCEKPADVARVLRGAGAKAVALKLGEEGCYLQTDKDEFLVPTFKVNAVDGTGTGDAWVAGLLTGMLKGWDLHRAAQFANATGALCVTATGATAGIRSFEETIRFMEQHNWR